MKIKILAFLVIPIFVASCSDDQLMLENEATKHHNLSEKSGRIVLQERDPALPSYSEVSRNLFENNKNISRSVIVDPLIGNSSALLGYSYKAGNGILGDFDNVGFPVINTDKLSQYVSAKQLLQFSTESFSFYEKEEYTKRIEKSQTISMSVGFGYKLFGMNISKTVEKSFYSEEHTEKEHLNSELDMTYNHSVFNLKCSQNDLNLYTCKYLTPQFLSDLYKLPMGKLVAQYGEFVLTGYRTGGKATALFVADIQSGSTVKQQMEKLDFAVKASVKADTEKQKAHEKDQDKDKKPGFLPNPYAGDSISVSVKFGKCNREFESSDKFSQSIRTKLSLYGGTPCGIGGAGAQKLTEVNLDLDTWLKSIIDGTAKHTIVSLTEGGLIPLSTLVLEQNFKQRINATANGELKVYSNLEEPYFEIERVFERNGGDGKALYAVRPILVTRQGDKIFLPTSVDKGASNSELARNNDPKVFNEKALRIKNEIVKRFQAGSGSGLTIEADADYRLNPYLCSTLCFDLSKINLDNLKKFKNPFTSVVYIYDDISKLAFSTYADELDGDERGLLRYYGFSTKWINSIHEEELSLSTILTYTIIGL